MAGHNDPSITSLTLNAAKQYTHDLAGLQDTFSQDTLGDYDVRNEWNRSAAQEAFVREPQEFRHHPTLEPEQTLPVEAFLGAKAPPGLSLPNSLPSPFIDRDLGFGPCSRQSQTRPFDPPLSIGPVGLGSHARRPMPMPAPQHVGPLPNLPPPGFPFFSPSPHATAGTRPGILGPHPKVIGMLPACGGGTLGLATSPFSVLGPGHPPPILSRPAAHIFGTSPFESALTLPFPPGLHPGLSQGTTVSSLLGMPHDATVARGMSVPQSTNTAAGIPPLGSDMSHLLGPRTWTLFSSTGTRRNPKVMSVEEVEAQMHLAASSSSNQCSLPQEYRETEHPNYNKVLPPCERIPATSAPSILTSSADEVSSKEEGAQAAVQATLQDIAQAAVLSDNGGVQQNIISPFTDAHRTLLMKETRSSALEPFLQIATQLRSHPSFMTSSDKDLIVRIQLSQMAAIGGQSAVQNYRGTFVHRTQKSKEHAEVQQDGACHASVLVTQLKETISSATSDHHGSVAAPKEQDPIAAEIEPAEGDRNNFQANPPGFDAGRGEKSEPENLAGDEVENPTDCLQSGLRMTVKFGSPLYASIHHPRRSICILSAVAGDGRASSDKHDVEENDSPSPTNPSGDSGLPLASTSMYWRTQRMVEQAYEELLELELLTYRLSDCHPLDAGKCERLSSERSSVLDRLSQQIFRSYGDDGHSPQGVGVGGIGEGGSCTSEYTETPLLSHLIRHRKGQVLLHRLFTCLLPPGVIPSERLRDEVVTPALHLLWRLLPRLLQFAPELLSISWASCSPNMETDAWQKLRLSLMQCVETACMQIGSGYSRNCAEVLAAILEGHGTCGVLEVCLSRNGTALLRQLVEGCGGERGSDSVAIEGTLDTLIEGICGVLPQLYDSALRNRRTEVANLHSKYGGSEVIPPDEADLLSQEDLWALLIAIAEQASVQQKRRIHRLIGGFVSTVTTDMGD